MALGSGNGFAPFAHVFDVHFKGFFHQSQGFLFRGRSGNTAGEIRRIRAEVVLPVFNEDCITHIILVLIVCFQLGKFSSSRDLCPSAGLTMSTVWKGAGNGMWDFHFACGHHAATAFGLEPGKQAFENQEAVGAANPRWRARDGASGRPRCAPRCRCRRCCAGSRWGWIGRSVRRPALTYCQRI